MNVGNSVRKAILDFEAGETDSAVLHACNAVDGTAKKELHLLVPSNKRRFTKFIRDNFAIFGPMALPNINLQETRWPIKFDSSPTTTDGQPDIADIVYIVHRCCHGHGDELPNGFELFGDAAGSVGITRFAFANGRLGLSDRLIFGLLAIAIASPKNIGQSVPAGYFLTCGERRFVISDWWGKKAKFEMELAMFRGKEVKLDLEQMTR